MTVNMNNPVSFAEACQDFSRVAGMVDENGSVVILKNDMPRYLVIEFGAAEAELTVPDEEILSVSNRIIDRNRNAYEVLAK